MTGRRDAPPLDASTVTHRTRCGQRMEGSTHEIHRSDGRTMYIEKVHRVRCMDCGAESERREERTEPAFRWWC